MVSDHGGATDATDEHEEVTKARSEQKKARPKPGSIKRRCCVLVGAVEVQHRQAKALVYLAWAQLTSRAF